MANALGEFLGGVAAAIRDMTGDPPEAKMKPVDFPEKIRSIETGADVSGVTATAENVLDGKVFVDAEGNEIVGSMTNKGDIGTKYLTPVSGGYYSIAKGYYDGGIIFTKNGDISITPTKNQQTFNGITTGQYYRAVTVFPIPGQYQDVTGVTATAEDVLEGKVIVDSAGYAVTGTLAMAGAGGVDVSGVTATAEDVLEGKVFVDAQGQETVGTFIYDVPGANETLLLRKQKIDGFVFAADFGAMSPGAVYPAPFTLEEGKKYRVNWDGTDYDCDSYAFTLAGHSLIGIGNGASFTLPGNGEPFMVTYNITVNDIQIFSSQEDESHIVGIYLDEGPKEGVDPYYSDLAYTLMTRDAKHLSGNERFLQLKGYKTPEGSTLGNLLGYSFAGFNKVEGMSFSDLMIVQENAFCGCSKLKVLDFTVTNGIGMMPLEGSLNTCDALEAVIFRGDTAFHSINVNVNHGSAANFYIYVPEAYYDTIISKLSSLAGAITDTSRFRKLEDYPEVDNWISQYQ